MRRPGFFKENSNKSANECISSEPENQAPYSKLKSSGSFTDIQFATTPQKVPWKAILLAITLFLCGIVLLSIAFLISSGVIDEKYSNRAWPLLVLGSLIFVPGFFHVRIAYYASTGQNGYTFNDIPDFD